MTQQEQTLYSLHARSPRYDRYEARIRAVRRILDGIRRHRIALAVTGAATVAAVLCFLAFVGHFIGQASYEDFVYGEKPQCSVKAFLSDTRYQYAPVDGEAAWSDAAPSLPGQYRIRAVSQNGFGQPHYGEAMTVTMFARKLSVRIEQASFVYGDFSLEIAKAHTRVEGLAPGDRVAELAYDAAGDEWGNFSVSVKSVRIVNAAGADVTAGYAVETADGYFTMTPRPITVSAEAAEKVYDGEIWNEGKAQLTGGSLVYGDQLHLSFSPAPAQAGTYPITPVCTVWSDSGENVTARYQITVQSADLTVQRRPISFSTGSSEKLYDGKALTNPQWSMTDGQLVEGHTLQGETIGTQTAAGKSTNRLRVTVLDAMGNDVSNNYLYSLDLGTLTVTPRKLKFQTDSAQKVYDGMPLSASGRRLVEGELAPGHKLTMIVKFAQIDVGSCENLLEVIIRDQNGVDVTKEGYVIEVDCGTLTVTPRSITVSSGSAEKLYDGTPLTCFNFSLVKGSLASGDYMSPSFTGVQTKVGSSSNLFTMQILNRNSNATFNYDITYIYGTLTVHENPNPPVKVPGSANDDKDNDQDQSSQSAATGLGQHGLGTQIGFPNIKYEILYAQVEGISGLRRDTVVYFRDASYGDYTGSGWRAAIPDTTFYNGVRNTPLTYVGRSLYESGKSSASMQINRMDGCPAILPYFTSNDNPLMADANDCYYENANYAYLLSVFTDFSYGDLKDRTVAYYDAMRQEKYSRYVYEEYLQIPESTKQALLAWAEQHGIQADSETLVEDIQFAITHAAAYNLNAEKYPANVDVVVYFLTEAKEGVCQHFASAATLMYRAFGIPARYTVGFMDTVKNGETTDLTSFDAHAWVEIYIDGLGWVPMEVTGSTAPEDMKRDLHIRAFSAVKYYDGEDFGAFDLAQYTILSGSLREGDTLKVSFGTAGYASTPGKYTNRITRCVVYDKNGRDVTDQYYDFYLYDGTLQILPRKITVIIGSASKVYDGMPLTCRDYWISEGSLVPGEELVVETEASLVEPGFTENTAGEIQILYTDNVGMMVDTTQCYEITVIPGYLEITEDTSQNDSQP